MKKIFFILILTGFAMMETSCNKITRIGDSEIDAIRDQTDVLKEQNVLIKEQNKILSDIEKKMK